MAGIGPSVRTLALLLAGLGLAAAPDPDRRVADASAGDDKAAVRALIRRGADVNAPQGDGTTALHWAAHWDDHELADLLIRSGADVNAPNDLGVTPLLLACENGSPQMVERLLAGGAKPNAPLRSGETPLMMASRTGSVRSVKALVARGADVNAAEQEQGQTALMWAAAERHADVVGALVEAGADVQARSRTWREVVLPSGASGTSRRGLVERTEGGYTPLLFAAQHGDVDTARLLIDGGADVDAASPEGATPLVIAAHSGHGKLSVYLLERGADPNRADAGYTALHVAILHRDLPLVRTLLSYGASANALVQKATPARRASRDYALGVAMVGASPLWLASFFKEPDIMRALIDNGADVSLSTPNGKTTLIASLDGRRVTEDDPAGPSDGAGNIVAAVTLALTLGVDVNAADTDGNTALHMAATKGLDRIVPLLVSAGARFDVKNKKGQTPLAAATASARGASDNPTVGLLRKLGATE